jgi:AMP-binding enzyme C-terminal domain/AMP-binding enzyme
MGALMHQVETRPRKTAFVFGEEKWSCERLAAEVGCLTRGLRTRGRDLPHGEDGELLVRSPNVFVGYWNGPDATSAALRDGWHQTGDMMSRGEGDELWCVSGKKHLIVCGGTKISPVEVERKLAAHPAVQEAAVVGVPDAVLAQHVFGFVKLMTSNKPSVVSEIPATAGTRLADYKVPGSPYVINELPRNVLGKLDRNALMVMGTKTGCPRFGDLSLQPDQSGENTLRAKHITVPTHCVEANGVRYAYRRFGSYPICPNAQRDGSAGHNRREQRSGLYGNSARCGRWHRISIAPAIPIIAST